MSDFCKYDAIAQWLFGGYKSYRIVESSNDHVVIDAELPYKVWEYEKLSSPYNITSTPPQSRLFMTQKLMPVALLCAGNKLRWKAVVFRQVSGWELAPEGDIAYAPDGTKMNVWAYTMSTFGKQERDGGAWCEWDGGRRTQYFRPGEVAFGQVTPPPVESPPSRRGYEFL